MTYIPSTGGTGEPTVWTMDFTGATHDWTSTGTEDPSSLLTPLAVTGTLASWTKLERNSTNGIEFDINNGTGVQQQVFFNRALSATMPWAAIPAWSIYYYIDLDIMDTNVEIQTGLIGNGFSNDYSIIKIYNNIGIIFLRNQAKRGGSTSAPAATDTAGDGLAASHVRLQRGNSVQKAVWQKGSNTNVYGDGTNITLDVPKVIDSGTTNTRFNIQLTVPNGRRLQGKISQISFLGLPQS